jgi:hypothetical protein
MRRHAAPILRRRLVMSLAWAVLGSAFGMALASAQTGPDQAPDEALASCDPFGIDPCPSPSPAAQSLSGGFTWTMVSTTPGGGELASTLHWDSTVTADMAWVDDPRMFLPRSGTYAYSNEYTGHCTGSVSGDGILATEPYGGGEPGVASVYADWAPVAVEDGALLLYIGIWRDDYDVHCAATRAFPANDYVDPGNTQHPYCTRVLASPTGGGTFSIACVEQDIEGVDVSVSGTLTLGP